MDETCVVLEFNDCVDDVAGALDKLDDAVDILSAVLEERADGGPTLYVPVGHMRRPIATLPVGVDDNELAICADCAYDG